MALQKQTPEELASVPRYSYTEVTGKSPFEGITLDSTEALGGLPESPPPIPYQDYITDIMNNFSEMGIRSSVDIQQMFQEQLATQQAEVEKTRAAREARIKEQFAPQISEAKEYGEKAIGGVKAISTRAGGLGASSIQEGMIRDQEKANNKMMADITARMSDAIARDDQNEISKVNTMYQQAVAMQDKIWQQKMQFMETKLKAMEVVSGMETREAGITGYYKGKPTLEAETQARTAEIQARTLDINTLRTLTDIPEGQSVEIGGITYTGLKKETIEPYFKGSDIVNLAKSLAVGQTQELTDPNTGTKYTIKGLASPELTTTTIQSTNNSTGEVMLTTYDKTTGQIIKQISAGKIGEKRIIEAPTSYKEWQLAGGEKGTGKTYSDWAQTKQTTDTEDFRKIVGGKYDEALNLLEMSKGTDGKVNTGLYKELIERFRTDYPDKPNIFTQLFPPQEYLNPEDPTSFAILKQSDESLLLRSLLIK